MVRVGTEINKMNVLVLMNHQLTPIQEKELKTEYFINKIIYPDKSIEKLWSSIKPEKELNIKMLDKIILWLSRNSYSGDYCIIQGEFGATFYLVDYCFKKKLIPIYAASGREYKEEILEDGSVKRVHIFRHVNFRKYIRYKV